MSGITKEEYLIKHNILLRPVTPEDRAVARTTYQRSADYIVCFPDGTEYFSQNGSMPDIVLTHRIWREKQTANTL